VALRDRARLKSAQKGQMLATSKRTPTTVNAAFNEFDEALNLDPNERKAAQDRHRQISDVLSEAGLAVTTFLQGSFARKTMLKPLKDVDMVVVDHDHGDLLGLDQ
jgi:tRNA nucleotidyltransferase (CCA-adding enzyme)